MSSRRRFAMTGAVSVLVALAAVAGLVRAEEKESLWQTGFAAAKAKAKAEKKLLLVNFTGSDWCVWCKKLKAEVFDKEGFKTEAPKQFVLVELDFPRRKKLSKELQKQNRELGSRYKVHVYPTVLLMDAEGKVVARTGYSPGGPEKYVRQLAEFAETYGRVLKMKQGLAETKGIDRARLLDQLVDAYVKLNNETDELQAWSAEIVALDADNKAGLKTKHEFRLLMADCGKLKAGKKWDEAEAAAEKALALAGITGEQKQGAYMALAELAAARTDLAGVVDCLGKALDAAPKSPNAPELKTLIAQFKPAVEAQEASATLKVELEEAKDLDRAKLLDRLIEAQNVLAGVGVPVQAKELEKWAREIVALDAENKAGLKHKYEFRLLLAEARTLLLKEKRTAEGQAVLAKALAMPELAGDQIQEANLLLGASWLAEEDFQKGIDCLKKAIDAAPKSPVVPQLKMALEQAERDLAKQPAKKRD